MKLINIGFGNMVSASRVIAIVSPESAPIKRIILDVRDRGADSNDYTGGRYHVSKPMINKFQVKTSPGQYLRTCSRDFVSDFMSSTVQANFVIVHFEPVMISQLKALGKSALASISRIWHLWLRSRKPHFLVCGNMVGINRGFP